MIFFLLSGPGMFLYHEAICTLKFIVYKKAGAKSDTTFAAQLELELFAAVRSNGIGLIDDFWIPVVYLNGINHI